jgi:hypothetical protein
MCIHNISGEHRQSERFSGHPAGVLRQFHALDRETELSGRVEKRPSGATDLQKSAAAIGIPDVEKKRWICQVLQGLGIAISSLMPATEVASLKVLARVKLSQLL